LQKTKNLLNAGRVRAARALPILAAFHLNGNYRSTF
jgi:hypothetical protein